VEDIDLEGLPENFVLKPTFMSSSYGVMVLTRTETGWRDDLWNKTYSLETIKTEQKRHWDASPASEKRFIVEEKIEDVTGALVPDDWKFFAFQGRIGLIHRVVRDSPRNRHAFFSGDFVPIASSDTDLITVNDKIVNRVAVHPPENWNSLVNAAKRVSTAVPSPFVRVDMYNSVRGPIFGEFTLVPGTFFYEDREKMMPALSTRLGQLWVEAERDLE